jgi:hypothetical protein
MNIAQSAERLTWLCNTLPALMRQIDEAEFAFKPLPTKWSKKEILGHLIDSAANNHQRFIRIQFETEPVIFYEQNSWNALSHYNEMNTDQIIDFWKAYNQYLIEIVKQIPARSLVRLGIGKDGQKYTLKFCIDDYVDHTEHHLKQIVAY